jgi:hypothetical protein
MWLVLLAIITLISALAQSLQLRSVGAWDTRPYLLAGFCVGLARSRWGIFGSCAMGLLPDW